MKLVLLLLLAAVVSASSAFYQRNDSNDPEFNQRGELPTIAGGDVDPPGNSRWLVSIQLGAAPGHHICGGTLINRNWVLTTAECLNGERPSELWAVVGDYDLEKIESSEQRLRIRQFFLHPDYKRKPNPPQNNIALLQLADSARLNHRVGVLKIAESRHRTGEQCVVAGWGDIGANGQHTFVIHAANIPILRKKQCTVPYKQSYLNKDSFICAGFVKGGVGFCNLDNGGPLVCSSGAGHMEVAAIASYRNGCAKRNFPGVYVNVAFYKDWIRKTMASAELESLETVDDLPESLGFQDSLVDKAWYPISEHHFPSKKPFNDEAPQEESLVPPTDLDYYGVISTEKNKDLPQISGGEIAGKGVDPWLVSIQVTEDGHEGIHFCGGALISEHWVLTAAHCIINEDKDFTMVVAGEYDMSQENGTEQRLFIKEFIIHPKFKPSKDKNGPFNNDVALIHLETPAITNRYVRALRLAEHCDHVKSSAECFMAGWGKTSTTSGDSNKVRYFQVPVLKKRQCRNSYKKKFLKKESVICAGFTTGDKGFCQHDDGGPMTCTASDGSPMIVGIASFQKGCVTEKFPGIYMDVSFYYDWIFKIISAQK